MKPLSVQQHELAFSLDRLGRRADDVERHYRSAVQLSPGTPRYQGRLICFLLVRGAVDDAWRQWRARTVTTSEDEADVAPYEELHLAVAVVALRRAELELARDALAAVPSWAATRLQAHGLAVRKLEALILAREGHAFVPLSRLRPGWWTAGPSLLPDRHNGLQRSRWMAARVEEVDEDGVHLRAALIEDGAGQTHPPTGTMVVPSARFEELSEDDLAPHELTRGRFLEIGLFGERGDEPETTVIRVLREEPWDDGLAPELDTGRYLYSAS